MIRKIVLPIAALFLFLSSINSQNLVSPAAFSKMMVDYYNFTLVGSQTPTTGFKVETSKPSITLKGNIYSNYDRRFITNLELEGGLNNGIMQLVSGSDLNKYVKANIGFSFLLPYNKAGHFGLTPTEYQLTYNAFQQNSAMLARQLDTFVVIKSITDEDNFANFTYEEFVSAVVIERNQSKYRIDSYKWQTAQQQLAQFDSLVLNVLLKYGASNHSNKDTVLNRFRRSFSDPLNSSIKTGKLLQDYDVYHENLVKDPHTLNDKQYDYEIKLTSFNWTWKKLKWINVSVSGSNSSFKLYNTSSATLRDSTSFLYGITGSFNYLFKGKESSKYHYLRGGLTVMKTNSVTDMQEFSYKKETVITVSPTEQLKSSKEGIAYVGDFKEKMGLEIFGEAFSSPWKSWYVPGFYGRAAYRASGAWLNKNKISLDLGMLFNVTNNDKDAKNKLTIVPYVSWSNLLTEYKDQGKTIEKSTADVFSFNVKFGIPFNVGK